MRGACRAVPQELAVEDFDAVAVVQPLVLPDAHLQPGGSSAYVHMLVPRAACHHVHAHATCACARVCTARAPHTHGLCVACIRTTQGEIARGAPACG